MCRQKVPIDEDCLVNIAKGWRHNRAYDWASVGQLRTFIALPKEREVARREEIPWIERRVHDLRVLIVIRSLLNDQDGEVSVGFRKPTCYHAAREATYRVLVVVFSSRVCV